MAESLKHKTLKATLWSVAERFSVQISAFIVMIVMARRLTPGDYGLIGMLTIFIILAQAIADSGFSQAIIRKQDRTATDNSTAFFFNIATGILLYALLFFCAPLIASFYHEPKLTALSRVMGLAVLLNSLIAVQKALLTASLDFRTQAKASVSGTFAGGAIGIAMAYTDYGVWAIVGYQLVNLSINASLLWILSKWRPAKLWSRTSFREMFGFGSKLALSGIIDTIYNNIYQPVIGKAFTPSDLGFYTRAQQFASLPSDNLTGVLMRVTFPVLCSIGSQQSRLRDAYCRFLRLSAFVIFPLMLCLAALSKPLISVLLGAKWLPAATMLPILCLALMWYPVHAVNVNLLNVRGRSDLFLKAEIIKKTVGIAILCITIPMGVIAMCWGLVASSLIALFINTYFTGSLISLGFTAQMRQVAPSLLYAMSAAFAAFVAASMPEPQWLQLCAGCFAAIITFLILTMATRSRDLRMLLDFIGFRPENKDYEIQ